MESSHTIHIWLGELVFMYDPLVFSAKCLLQQLYPKAIIDHQAKIIHEWSEVKRGDTVVWIGCFRFPHDELKELRERGVYTVYYNTEPAHCPCFTDEIWTYSKSLYEIHVQAYEGQIIKYMPIVCEEGDEEHQVSFVPYSETAPEKLNLSFIGNFVFRKDKQDMLMKSEILARDLEEINNLWSDKDYNNFMAKKANIYLNVTKTHFPFLPTVRINKLLSHKCIIISERTNEIDDSFYSDMVIFTDLENIPAVYESLLKKTPEELQAMADGMYEKFFEKFTSKKAVELILSRTAPIPVA